MKDITNKKAPKIGLALGSGSARGMAHIGVIRALQENSIPISRVCGCSMGAIIGALYCSGNDLEMFGRLCAQMKTKEFLDITVPRRGLIKGERFESLLHMMTKEKTFDQMEPPFACIACDLAKGETVVFDQGGVATAVRASISIPGIFEPKWINGVLYVDGGTLCPVPITATRSMGADFVIGVDVGAHKGEPANIDDSIWQVFLRSLDVMAAVVTKEENEKADLLIEPPLSDIAQYSTEDIEHCIELGYQETIARMADIKNEIEKWSHTHNGTGEIQPGR